MSDLYLLVYLCGYMVTAVTVTVFGVLEARHIKGCYEND